MKTLGIMLCCAFASAGEPPPDVRRALTLLDAPLVGVLPWVARLHDPASGGFRISVAAVERGLPADFQSSTQAVLILHKSGALAHVPAPVRARMAVYFTSRQRADGWFVDPNWPEHSRDPRLSGRSLGFSLKALAVLNVSPPYALPGDATAPPHLASPAALRTYIRELDWKRPWQAVDRISSLKDFLTGMSTERRAALVTVVREEISARQDPATGWVGSGPPTETLSACAKLGWFCLAVGEPIPRADAIQRSLLKWYALEDDVPTMTLVRNPMHHLSDLQAFVGGGRPDAVRLATIIRYAARQTVRFLRSDGGLSMNINSFPVRPNDVMPPVFTATLPQGDLNGTAQAFTVREHAWRLAGAEAPPLTGNERAATLFAPE